MGEGKITKAYIILVSLIYTQRWNMNSLPKIKNKGEKD